jgi:hypothetical protein
MKELDLPENPEKRTHVGDKKPLLDRTIGVSAFCVKPRQIHGEYPQIVKGTKGDIRNSLL